MGLIMGKSGKSVVIRTRAMSWVTMRGFSGDFCCVYNLETTWLLRVTIRVGD